MNGHTMEDFTAQLQNDLEDINRRLDVLERRFGIIREPKPISIFESVFSEREEGSETPEERAERRHQEFMAAAQRFLERCWNQVTAPWEVKQPAPKHWIQ